MARKTAYYGIFAALAILMGYVEAVIPIPVPVPGIKLGLSNIVVLLCMYVMGRKEAFFISVVRVLISALLFKGFVGLWYSLAGAFLSYFAMLVIYKLNKASIIGVSVTYRSDSRCLYNAWQKRSAVPCAYTYGKRCYNGSCNRYYSQILCSLC